MRHMPPMLQLLTPVGKEVQQVTHLNNQEKNKAPSRKDVGRQDTLDKAKDLHQNMTVEGNIHLPPECNINDSQTSPKGGHRAKLTQCKHNRN